MKTALVLTLGFDEKFCYRAILRHGISEGDRIILLTAGAEERVRKAFEWIRRFVESSNISVELVEIDVRDFHSGLIRVLSILRGLDSYRLIVNLSGGMRILSLIVYIALTIAGKDAEVELELEDFSAVVRIPATFITLCTIPPNITDEKLQILNAVGDGEMSISELARTLNKDVTTVRRHVSALAELGLLDVLKRKPMVVRATPEARILAEFGGKK